ALGLAQRSENRPGHLVRQPVQHSQLSLPGCGELDHPHAGICGGRAGTNQPLALASAQQPADADQVPAQPASQLADDATALPDLEQQARGAERARAAEKAAVERADALRDGAVEAADLGDAVHYLTIVR